MHARCAATVSGYDARDGRQVDTWRSVMARSSVKDERQYEALRRKGESKEKAARIANASANTSRSSTGRKGGTSRSYDDWSKTDLVNRAREIGIEGRSRMSKAELVKALRNH
jgi:hypothetical protein